VSSPTDPQPPARPTAPAQQTTPPTTQEIPVPGPAVQAQQLPPHPGATTPAPVHTVQPTGPVALVPGLPGPLPPPPPPAAAPAAAAPAPSGATATQPAAAHPTVAHPTAGTSSWPDSLETGPVPFAEEAPAEPPAPAREPRDRTALLALGLVTASLVLLELGLGLRFGGESFWSDIPLWSAFATASAVLGLAGSARLLPAARRPSATTAWGIAAAGLVGLAVFWLLVVLPVVASDRGFLLTAALGCLGGALWTGPARRA
jgi:hypothetical protein